MGVIDYTHLMPRNKKELRNEELIRKRIEDPEKWTWGKLAELFEISRYTARDLYYRHIKEYSKQWRERK